MLLFLSRIVRGIEEMPQVVEGVYKRGHPERTDYYRVIEGYYQEFENCYTERFEEKHGYLRKKVTAL